MANRDNHYEAAFEEYLRVHGIPYVAVDEAKRSRWAEASIKSLDFIVSPRAARPGWSTSRGGGFLPANKSSIGRTGPRATIW